MGDVTYPEPGKVAQVMAAALDGLNDEELRHHLAVTARQNAEAAALVCCRVARELRFPGQIGGRA